MMILIIGFTDPPTINFKFIKKCMRQLLLQGATAYFITNCDGLLSQSVTAFLLKRASDKCYYKLRQAVQSATILLQSEIGITKCDRTVYREKYRKRSFFILQKGPGRGGTICFTLACLCFAYSWMTLMLEIYWYLPKGYYIILLSFPFCSKPIRKNGIKHKTIETEPVVTLFDNVLKGGGGGPVKIWGE